VTKQKCCSQEVAKGCDIDGSRGKSYGAIYLRLQGVYIAAVK